MKWSGDFFLLPFSPIPGIPAKCRMQFTEPDGKGVIFFLMRLYDNIVNECFNEHGVINL